MKKGKKRRHDQSLENQTGDKRKKTRSQDSDEDANDNASDTSSTTGGRDSVAPDHDASSVCSNSSNNNDDAASNRSCSPAGNRIEAPGPVVLPDHFKRVICGEEGRSCVRTDVIFVRPRPEKPKKEPTCSRETSVSKESPSKAEVCKFGLVGNSNCRKKSQLVTFLGKLAFNLDILTARHAFFPSHCVTSQKYVFLGVWEETFLEYCCLRG